MWQVCVSYNAVDIGISHSPQKWSGISYEMQNEVRNEMTFLVRSFAIRYIWYPTMSKCFAAQMNTTVIHIG